MPFVLSKLANTQVYTKYAKGIDNVNIPVEQVEIKGGADITDKNLVTPQGVITKVTDAQLEILKENKDFQKHLENGHINYFNHTPNVEKQTEKMEKDKSAPLTPEHYKKQGKKEPKVNE